ncbi:MAG: Smr/MutS family protein [Dehalococcoidales bacterium]|nr:Smr/MutS family protein [Dehalococcoidales bacterium]
MSTVFESLSDSFYTAFFEPDPDKRKNKIEAWIKESTPVIQEAVENDLRVYLDGILEATWNEKDWKSRAQKYYSQYVSTGINEKLPFIDAYKLYLDVKIRTHAKRNKDLIIGTLSHEIREKTNKAIETAKTAIAKLEPPSPISLRVIDLHGNTVDEAIPITETFLRECYRDNVRRIRIIHGKGIFVLQKAIRTYLGTHKFIKSETISPAEKDNGGEGATEANLTDFSVNNLD